MIQLTKLQEPDILIDNKSRWDTQLKSYLKTNGGKFPSGLSSKYGHEEIRNLLKDETKSKCMYCESKIEHIDYPNVEHIKPKSKFPDLMFEWDNLGLACSICNRNKLDYYSDDYNKKIINPYQDRPMDYIWIFGHHYKPKLISNKGEITINKLDLNRSKLVEKRKDQLDHLESLILRENEVQDPIISANLKREIHNFISQNSEYSIFANKLYNYYYNTN